MKAGPERFSLGRGLLAATDKRLLFVYLRIIRSPRTMSFLYDDLAAYSITPSAILAKLVLARRDGSAQTFWHVDPLGRVLALGAMLSSKGCSNTSASSRDLTGATGPG